MSGKAILMFRKSSGRGSLQEADISRKKFPGNVMAQELLAQTTSIYDPNVRNDD
jgi:hypothetical protein